MRSMSSPIRWMTARSVPKILDADWCLNAGQQHVEAVPDRLCPDVGETWELQRLIHLALELLGGQSRPPFIFGLQRHGRVDHPHRRVVGRGRRAADRSEDALDFGELPK